MSIWFRLRFACFRVCDRLFGTHMMEREAARLRRAVEELEAHTSALRQELALLEQLLHVIQVQMCALYLCQRSVLRPTDWLRFAPAEDETAERDLDLLIERLVKHGLATARTERVGERLYVYHLQPDWAAIAGLLARWSEMLDPAVLAWVEERRDATPPPPVSPPALHHLCGSPPPAPRN